MNQTPKVAIYAREIKADQVTPLRNARGQYPPDLRRLLQQAAQVPRPFDILSITTESVLGTPQEKQEVERRLRKYGIVVKVTDEERTQDRIKDLG